MYRTVRHTITTTCSFPKPTGPVGRWGVASVEMAIAVPVLLFVMYGLIEFGNAFMVQHQIQDAVRQGCREAIRPRSDNDKVTQVISRLLTSPSLKKAKTSILVNDATGDVSSSRASDVVAIEISVNVSDITLIPGMRFLTGKLSASSSLRRD
ncbi:MAG: pilus assembly protein [Planctomycetes bacterium]|nr:pilus assembly protein [Planctomycetota bacterium]